MLLRCWYLWDSFLRYMLLRCWDPWDFLTTWHVATRLRSLGSFTTLQVATLLRSLGSFTTLQVATLLRSVGSFTTLHVATLLRSLGSFTTWHVATLLRSLGSFTTSDAHDVYLDLLKINEFCIHFFLTQIQLSKLSGRTFYIVNYRWLWLSWKQPIKTLARFPFRRVVYDLEKISSALDLARWHSVCYWICHDFCGCKEPEEEMPAPDFDLDMMRQNEGGRRRSAALS